MSIHRRKASKDNNQRDIVRALESVGVFVQPLSGAGVPDLLVGYNSQWLLMEVKSERGKLTPAQSEWHALAHSHNLPLVIVRSVGQALDAVTD